MSIKWDVLKITKALLEFRPPKANVNVRYQFMRSKSFAPRSIPLQEVAQVADFFIIVHHIPGRIRIRANLKNLLLAKKWAQTTELREFLQLKDFDSGDSSDTHTLIISLLERIKAVQSIKVNMLIGSATICYDKNLFAPYLWESWIKKERLDEITAKLNDFV